MERVACLRIRGHGCCGCAKQGRACHYSPAPKAPRPIIGGLFGLLGAILSIVGVLIWLIMAPFSEPPCSHGAPSCTHTGLSSQRVFARGLAVLRSAWNARYPS